MRYIMDHATYNATRRNGHTVVIDTNGPQSVTNDVEHVFATLADTIPGFNPTQGMVYLDGTGRWDGVYLNDDGAVEFVLLDASTEAEAITQYNQRRTS